MTIRQYQLDMINAVTNDFSSHDKLLCVAPTGSGKTYMFGGVIDWWLKNNDSNVIIISHLSILVKQNAESLKQFYSIESEVLKADNIPKGDKRVTITTMQSFRDPEKVLIWGGGGNIGMAVIDETHFFGNDSYNSISKMFPSIKYLGVTATPFRKNKHMTNMFDKISYTCSTKDMIDLKHLVPPELQYFNFSTGDVSIMAKELSQIYKLNHTGRKAIVFLRSIDECNVMRKLFIVEGIRSEAITSEIVDDQRDSMLSAFRAGEAGSPDVLVTVNVLTAGFDSPNVEAIFMPYQTKSVVTYLQRIGRGLRPYKNKVKCMVYVGGESPSVIDEYIELNDKAVKQGTNKRIQDEYVEKPVKSKQEIWNESMAVLVSKMRKCGFKNIESMIQKGIFPENFLNLVLKVPPVKNNAKPIPATDGQVRFLKSINAYQAGMTKNEASYILNRFDQYKGKVSSVDIAQDGKFKGHMWSEIPHAYKSFLQRNPNSELAKSYREWCNKVRKETGR